MSRRAALSWAVLLVALSAPLAAQTTFATITGAVADPSGTVVPGVTITATHVASNYRYATQSNAVGYYSLAQLREGEYELRANSPGFKEYVVRDVQLYIRA